jgi:choline-sulfatase
MKKKPILIVAAAVLLVAAATVFVLLIRTPVYLRPQRHVASPVLKPAGVSERSFFFAPPYFLMRLDAAQPAFAWQFAAPARGFLEVSFFAYPGAECALTFAVTQEESGGRKRKLVRERFRLDAERMLTRSFRAGVALPAGGRLRFEVLPEPGKPWPAFDIGISVPRIVTGTDDPPPANLLIVSIDTLRSDAVGVYRELAGRMPTHSPSPELDRFASEAVVFRNARTTQSATWPALASLHLSKYPKAHGITFNGYYLSEAYDSIAETMLERGYATVSLLNNAYELNIPGFEEKWKFLKDGHLAGFAPGKIGSQGGAPFFHWYHFWGVHANYKPPKWAMEQLQGRKLGDDFPLQYNTNKMLLGELPYGEREVEAVRGLYEGAMVYTDSLLKKIFDDLKRRGLWDRTLVIVTADHGEELHDHNRYFYHSPSLFDSAIHVPLLIKFPGQRRRILVEENVSLLDIFPTVYDYFIGDPPAGRFAGRTLLGLLRGEREPFRERVLLAEAENSQIAAAYSGRHKLIFNPRELTPLNHVGRPFPIAKVEFYDLQADPGEHRDLKADATPDRGRLLRAAEKFLREKAAPQRKRKGGKVEISDEMKRQAEEKLRSLGYIR